MRACSFVLAAAALSFLGSAQQLRADGETKKTQEAPKPTSETIQIQDVPKAVVDAVKAKYPDGQMQKAKKKVENGKTFFGIGLTSKGTAHNVLMTPKGKIVEHKKVIPASELPAKVTEAIYASYPNSTTNKAEKVTEYKEEKSFKLEVLTSDKQTKKLVIDAEGKIKVAK
jgi:hypothetical protein